MPIPCPARILIAADIFGVTPELGQLARALGSSATLVSPHPHMRSFRNETEGYASFMKNGGVSAYAAYLGSVLTRRRCCFELALGFSAGANALWLCLADAALEPWLPRRAELYYGSRIRENAHLQPRRRALLTFAEKEASFDAVELATRLRLSGHAARVLPGSAHGFMNPLSRSYDERLATQETTRLQALLEVGPFAPRKRNWGRAGRLAKHRRAY